jgi:hypothetical protein
MHQGSGDRPVGCGQDLGQASLIFGFDVVGGHEGYYVAHSDCEWHYLVWMPQCFQCEQDNPSGQGFCGTCGSPLVLREYVAAQVSKGIASSIQNRDILETESSIKVFERAYGWIKLILGAAAALLAIVGTLGLWKATDWWSEVSSAKQVVADAADKTRKEITQTSTKAVGEIQEASSKAVAANEASVREAGSLSGDLNRTATRTKSELAKEADSVKTEVASSQVALQGVQKLQPEFDSMRAQLSKATSDLAAQQKVISNSEDFVKTVFSSHAVVQFSFEQFVKPTSVVIPGRNGQPTFVYMLLPSTPIAATLQLQYFVAIQPPGSYFNIHNLVIFSWSDPADNLKLKPISASYFPDSGDKEIIHALSEHDGRVFADDQPLPKFGQPDPDFKGDKWIPPPASVPAPTPPQPPR